MTPHGDATARPPMLSITSRFEMGYPLREIERRTSCARRPPTIASVGGKWSVAWAAKCLLVSYRFVLSDVLDNISARVQELGVHA